jgi:hypothetical protein
MFAEKLPDPSPISPVLDAPPDVWWGTDGIDALLWADPPPPYVAFELKPELPSSASEPEGQGA